MSVSSTTADSPMGTALITEATSGIGPATALRLARDGWDVVVHGRSHKRGADVVREIEGHGGRARFRTAV
jgi:NAD(P)-dependent dehydrogenase (short-subunit alcohol dehydrogenase family)